MDLITIIEVGFITHLTTAPKLGFGYSCLMILMYERSYSSDSEHNHWSLLQLSSLSKQMTDTRFIIWVHLLATIQDNILWGVGSLKSTVQASPLQHLDFTMNRNNLAAHSLYFEIMYRWGIVGLFLFLSIILALWTGFWKGRNMWEIKIAGSLIVSILFFASSSVAIIFSEMEMRWGFVWLFFGIAFGSSLPKTSIRSNKIFNKVST